MTLSLGSSSALADTVEVLHWWTSGGEKEAADQLKAKVEADGHTWKDAIITGGGGDNAMKVLRQRAVSGNAPSVVQMKGPAIQEWGTYLVDVDAAAKKLSFDKILPTEVKSVMKHKGKYVAVPVNVHRTDWVWANKKLVEPILAKAKNQKGFDQILFVGKELKKKGVQAFAHGGQPWQDATAFEAISLSVGGPEFYQKAFVDLDLKTLKGPKMKDVFEKTREYTKLLDPNRKGLDWDKATKLVIEGKAGMQLMGDWAKGEFLVAGQKPGKDFLCFPVPTAGQRGFLFNIDSFTFFKQKSGSGKATQGQLSFAKQILTPDFQQSFNLKKGSIPVRVDSKVGAFDKCAKDSFSDFTNDKVRRLPSFAHKMAMQPDVESAVVEVITGFFNSNMTPDSAVKRLSSSVEEIIED
ncbi:MAG: carbohydrate ABC transporter substrate-binding protein [Pseudobacteriovorax sp.]|nr:carbohydrate ABC transporter substrate-binding protein [Pseudobacteriovorax sp.]